MKPAYMRSRPDHKAFKPNGPNQNGPNGSRRNNGRNNGNGNGNGRNRGRNKLQASGINAYKVSAAGWKDQEKRGIPINADAPAFNSNTRKDKINVSAKLNVAGYRTRKINVKDTSEIMASIRRKIHIEFKKENIANYPTQADELEISYNNRIIGHQSNQVSIGDIFGLNNRKPKRRKTYTLTVTFNGLQAKNANRSQEPRNGKASAVPPRNNRSSRNRNGNNGNGNGNNNRSNRSRSNARNRGCSIM